MTNETQSKNTSKEYLELDTGESVSITVSRGGIVVIQVERIDENTTLGSIVISGLSPTEVSSISKGFWGGLWKKIKDFVGDVIDTVTVPVGPFTCRPTASVGFQDGKVISVSVGLSCRD